MKRLVPTRRCPAGKIAYPSKRFALLCHAHLSIEPSAYLCPHCGHWHLTRSEDRGDLMHDVVAATFR